MSYTRLEAREDQSAARAPAGRLPLGWMARALSVTVWALINAALLFAEYLAELLAPILLFAGAVWWAIPKGLDALKLDGPANDILQQVRAHVATELFIGGDYYSAHTLIYDGLLCVAAVAICRTLSGLITNLLLDRP